jgi:AbiV family abortive infection protein
LADPTISADDLLKGAWHALEQAGILFDNAVLLFDADQWATSVGVAMLGREEFGRSRILRDLAAKAATTPVSVSEVRARCEDHAEKQAKGIASHVFKPPPDSALGRAISTLTEKLPSSPEAAAANAVIDSAVKAQRKRLPHERHEQRMQAFYVDVTDSGNWVRPVTIRRDEAREIVEQAVNDYAVKFHNLETATHAPDMNRVKKLMEPAPQLPQPRWPKRTDATQ